MTKQVFVRKDVHADIINVRNNFAKLIVANPNYFGNLQGDNLPEPIFALQGNTFYENLGCLGLQPELDLLKAVLYINQDNGYSGGLCTHGSQEYVRFYLSFDHGASWQDQGVTSITVYDINHEGRLEYAVEMPISPEKRPCWKPNQILARAILSWNVPPPPNSPNYVPVWGNHVDANILVRTANKISLKDLLDSSAIKEMGAVIDLSQTVALKQKPVIQSVLIADYKKANVELHRAVFPFTNAVLEKPAMLSALQASPFLAKSELKVDLSDAVEVILNTQGNTDFEELNCIGLQPSTSIDHLVGILKVKKPLGYYGGLCSHGSIEYVRFYMDFGTGWQDMGLSSVRVFDIAQLPGKGLDYAVFLPVDLSKHRKPCQSGPVMAKMRAILSWNVAPPQNTPSFKPLWGNAEDTVVLLAPGTTIFGSNPVPMISAICGQSTANIDPSSGLLNNGGFVDAPFGNSLWVSGFIGNAPDISSGFTKLKYRLLFSTDGSNFKPVATAFDINRDQLSGGSWISLPQVTQTPAADGFVDYQVDITSPVITLVNLNILGVLNTSAADPSPFRWLKVEVQDPINSAIIYPSNTVKVCVDNQPPTASITMDQGSCSDIHIKDIITGKYAASDSNEHYSSTWISVLGGSGGVVIKTPVTGPTEQGETGTWKLDTTNMTACGYVIQLGCSDRTLIGYASAASYYTSVGWTYYPGAIGFCLKP
jgi:hypothetical protein